MKANQKLRGLGPRIKLLKRHVIEWSDLLEQQKQIRRLAQEQANRQSSSHCVGKMAMLEQVTNQVFWLTQLSIRHTEERQQLKARHQQEEVDLEQIINMLK
ncbi:hypothetical protein ACFSUS_15230 [Spirosoma soli]|uniref:Flagellar export protein FliJ n=1 Tax=Spirosoma soli TaxID=1770529 RepID=A0ABW5M4Q4_9BACT